jgi:hypothetical protein
MTHHEINIQMTKISPDTLDLLIKLNDKIDIFDMSEMSARLTNFYSRFQ